MFNSFTDYMLITKGYVFFKKKVEFELLQLAFQSLSSLSVFSSLHCNTGIIAAEQSLITQRNVIEFLLTKGETALNISRTQEQVYDDNMVDYNTVTRWVKRINDRQKVGYLVKVVFVENAVCRFIWAFVKRWEREVWYGRDYIEQ